MRTEVNLRTLLSAGEGGNGSQAFTRLWKGTQEEKGDTDNVSQDDDKEESVSGKEIHHEKG